MFHCVEYYVVRIARSGNRSLDVWGKQFFKGYKTNVDTNNNL